MLEEYELGFINLANLILDYESDKTISVINTEKPDNLETEEVLSQLYSSCVLESDQLHGETLLKKKICSLFKIDLD